MADVGLNEAIAQEIVKIVFDRWYKQLGLAECLEIVEIFQKSGMTQTRWLTLCARVSPMGIWTIPCCKCYGMNSILSLAIGAL